MDRVLLLTVRLYEGRFHGAGEDHPSPARLFQALIAGAAVGGVSAKDREAFEWLETLAPPVLAVPQAHRGQRLGFYVPNNDLDAKGGDPARVAEVRVLKRVQPWIFDPESPFLFAWKFGAEDGPQAETICALSRKLYQLGRGVDPAWAEGEILDAAQLEERLESHPGRILRPSGPGGDEGLRCPAPGTFQSLQERFDASRSRLLASEGDPGRQLLVQPPKPRFVNVAYGAPGAWRVFELRRMGDEGRAFAWALERAHDLVVAARDAAVKRLEEALPDLRAQVEAALIGRQPDGSGAGPTSARVRLVPLPSIGHEHADHQVRRLLVEVPAGCALSSDDVSWAFSGLEFQERTLVPSWTDEMLRHYRAGAPHGAQLWRSITPAVLPQAAARRRVDPLRRAEQAKGGTERLNEEATATEAVRQALRHAEVRARIESIRVQREPFGRRGDRAEVFAEGTRFAKERLWHVELVTSSHIDGPLLMGDGRFLGLGLLAPVRQEPGLHAFEIEGGLTGSIDPVGLARALRRAVMARVQQEIGAREPLAPYFTGHGQRGEPSSEPHLYYLVDPAGSRLMVLGAHRVEHREPSFAERELLKVLGEALGGLSELRAGRAGRLRLRPTHVDLATDPLFAPARTWETSTPYQVTRHLKRSGAREALEADVRTECQRLAFPVPTVIARDPRGVKGVGLVGNAELRFDVAVPGPIALGRSRHLGGGIFSGKKAHAERRRPGG